MQHLKKKINNAHELLRDGICMYYIWLHIPRICKTKIYSYVLVCMNINFELCSNKLFPNDTIHEPVKTLKVSKNNTLLWKLWNKLLSLCLGCVIKWRLIHLVANQTVSFRVSWKVFNSSWWVIHHIKTSCWNYTRFNIECENCMSKWTVFSLCSWKKKKIE